MDSSPQPNGVTSADSATDNVASTAPAEQQKPGFLDKFGAFFSRPPADATESDPTPEPEPAPPPIPDDSQRGRVR